MKLTIRNRNLTAAQSFDQLIENKILGLAGRHTIDEVLVILERREQGSPAFQVILDVAVPGPNIRAEQFDHSPVQAFTRALSLVERRLRLRALNRAAQTRNRGLRTAGARMNGARTR